MRKRALGPPVHPGAMALAVAALVAVAPAMAQEAGTGGGGGEAVDPSGAYGFGVGAGILDVGQSDVQLDATLSWGRREGDYATAALGLMATRGVTGRLEAGVTASALRFDIAGVPALDDTDGVRFVGIGAVTKWSLRERDEAGRVGLGVHVSPRWAWASAETGAREDSVGVDARVIAEMALVPDTLYGALGVAYAPTWTWPEEGPDERASTLDVSAALALRAGPDAVVGVEARLASSYEGAALDRLAGRALYVGPTVSVRVADGLSVNAAIEAQVAGEARGEPGRDLDLTNHERVQVRLEVKRQF